MARTLASSAYTHQQVYDQLRADGRRFGARFEVLDNSGQRVDPGWLTTVVDAQVSWDGDRPLGGSLQLTMTPDAAMLDKFLTRRIRAWWDLTMSDGGTVSFPMGVFMWTRPERSLTSIGKQLWTITLADLTHLLDLSGPGITPYNIPANSRAWDHVAAILRFVGIDATLVPAGTGSVCAVDTSFDLKAPNGRTQTWLTTLRQLNATAGAWFPWFDGAGNYRPDPVADLRYAPAQIVYATDALSIVADAKTSAKLELFANRVIGTLRNAGGWTDYAIADADLLLPGHPGAHNQIGFYVDVPYDDALASNAQDLARNVQADLYQRISLHENVTVNGWLNPQHEGFDVCSLEWTDDEVYGTPTRFLCRSRTQNLIAGTQSIVLYSLLDGP